METFRPITPREEMDALLYAAIDIALNLLSRHQSHLPFAIVIDKTGKRSDLAPDDRETRDYFALEQAVIKELRAMVARGQIRSIVLARNIEYRSAIDGTQVDAIEVTLDQLGGAAVTCVLPYRRTGAQTVEPGELFAIDPRERFF